LIDSKHPLRHARYELKEIGQPNLADALAPLFVREEVWGAGLTDDDRRGGRAAPAASKEVTK
jgi:hypothetical protein